MNKAAVVGAASLAAAYTLWRTLRGVPLYPDVACMGRRFDQIDSKIDRLVANTIADERIINLMATLQEALDGWRSYTTDLKAATDAANARADAAVAALDDANNRAQTAAQALSDFQADDAATDAHQLADQAQQDADAVQAALDEVKAPPPPPVEPPPVIEEPVE